MGILSQRLSPVGNEGDTVVTGGVVEARNGNSRAKCRAGGRRVLATPTQEGEMVQFDGCPFEPLIMTRQ